MWTCLGLLPSKSPFSVKANVIQLRIVWEHTRRSFLGIGSCNLALLSIIRASLGLAPREDDRLLYSTLEERTSKVCMSGLSSAILDAEMVCHSESKGDIDGTYRLGTLPNQRSPFASAEFWRLRSLVESTARGVRCSRHHRNRQHRVQVSQSQDSTQCWSQSSPECVRRSTQ